MIIISVIIKSFIITSFIICVGFSCADLSKIGRAYLGTPNLGLYSKITESLPRSKNREYQQHLHQSFHQSLQQVNTTALQMRNSYVTVQAMHLYIQNAKTTHFRCGGNGWFRAC